MIASVASSSPGKNEVSGNQRITKTCSPPTKEEACIFCRPIISQWVAQQCSGRIAALQRHGLDPDCRCCSMLSMMYLLKFVKVIEDPLFPHSPRSRGVSVAMSLSSLSPFCTLSSLFVIILKIQMITELSVAQTWRKTITKLTVIK